MTGVLDADSVDGRPNVVQIGLIVRDIETTAQAYAALLGVDMPEWSLTGPVEEAHTRYRGEPTEARAKLAFFRLGNVQIELIEPVGAPSTWREFLDAHGEGVHHIAFAVDGMQEQVTALEAQEMPLVQRGDYTGGRYAYIDSSEQLKVILELLEND
jgi:catechol 2,3-dioxygenase-like lactoylglutathione lyase family enzyme